MLMAVQGSTCAFTERMLREAGFRTGLFTSPHLLDVRERFRFNGLVFELKGMLAGECCNECLDWKIYS